MVLSGVRKPFVRSLRAGRRTITIPARSLRPGRYVVRVRLVTRPPTTVTRDVPVLIRRR